MTDECAGADLTLVLGLRSFAAPCLAAHSAASVLYTVINKRQ